MKTKVFAIMGEAGSGKDYLVKQLVQSEPSLFNEIISYTTRPKRDNEIDGVHYHFVSVNEFLSMNLLESTIFNDWYYGTGLNALVDDKINLGVFNPAGVDHLLRHEQLDTQVYRLEVLPQTRLIRQLSRETYPNIDEIIRRYGTDKKDFQGLRFNYTPLKNNNFVELQKAMDYITVAAKRALGKID